MRKRLVSAALAAAMALSMTACTSNPAEKETEAAAPADTEAAEEGEEKEAAADGDLITVGYAKVALILFLACIVTKNVKEMGKIKTLFKIMLMVLPVVGLVGASNLSTAIIILGIAVILIFVASPKYAAK